ncbi:MAG: glutaredoxin family protein [Candidatus Micrarchaeia archaeon]
MKLFTLIFAFLVVSSLVYATCIDIFYLPSCPHCEQALSFFYNISQNYNLTINEYNVENPNVTALFRYLSNYYNSSAGVPLIFIGNETFLGFAYGNISQQVNSKLSIGYSSQLTSALKNSGNSCPVLPNNLSCKNCYTQVLPNEAKKLKNSNFLTNIYEAILVAVLIIIAIFLVLKIRRKT